jgi:hypothetical protein
VKEHRERERERENSGKKRSNNRREGGMDYRKKAKSERGDICNARKMF